MLLLSLRLLMVSLTINMISVAVASSYRPHIIFAPDYTALSSNPKKAADSYLQHYLAQKPHLKIKNFRWLLTKRSLNGYHVTYQQYLDNIAIEYAEIIVSVANDGSFIYRVFDHSVPAVVKHTSTSKKKIKHQQAYDIAWHDMKVDGLLIEEPQNSRKYILYKNKLFLVWVTNLAVSSPFGYWRHDIAVNAGKIIKRTDQAIRRIGTVSLPKLRSYGRLTRRLQEFSRFFRAKKHKKNKQLTKLVKGEASVFFPDPRTFLQDVTLVDSSATRLFQDALKIVNLPAVTFDGNSYFLSGPWIELSDFEEPNISPQTSLDATWHYQRGDDGLNDAMTYYNIDNNQRYVQSLGYVGQKGIQYNKILVDSNGLAGSDNSHYIPQSNKLAFGHGCIDDNEDSDVILHEYAHALQYDINPNWYGGDTGAMGEGFGDYWAYIYSGQRLPNKDFEPERVFNWDGADGCWGGRTVNARFARYRHQTNYLAHENYESFVADELWSTPLVQARKKISALGLDVRSFDKIILESHFGLGADLKMRDMAKVILATATSMYPQESYADILRQQFAKHLIIDIPHANISLESYRLNGDFGDNGKLDPGEKAQLFLTSKNHGTSTAQDAKIILDSWPSGVSEPKIKNVSLGDLLPRSYQEQKLAFSFDVNYDHPCGKPLQLEFNWHYYDFMWQQMPFKVKIPTGHAIEVENIDVFSPPLDILDNNQTGLFLTLPITALGKLQDIEVTINIKHPYRADLSVILITPGGKKLMLHDRSGSEQNDLVGTYPHTLWPVTVMSTLYQENISGNWQLQVIDNSLDDIGEILSWGLKLTTGYSCD